MHQDDLVNALSGLSSDRIKEITEAAQLKRVRDLEKNVPESEIARLVAAYQLWDAGQKFSCNIDLPITIKAHVRASFEFGHIDSWEIELRKNADALAEKFFEDAKPILKDVYYDDISRLENLIPRANDACHQESDNYDRYRRALCDFEEKFQLDPHSVLKARFPKY